MNSITFKNFDPKTKQGRLFKALVQDGKCLTENQITRQFGLKNPTAAISRIRSYGYPIYANQRKAGNNVQVTVYSHGSADRRLVAAGYRAIAMGLVD
jgi:hypothetical protein